MPLGFVRHARKLGFKGLRFHDLRGSHETALLDALNRGIVRDAAIDVWSTEGEEPTDIVRALQHHPSVLPTTHIGAYTRGVQRRCAMQVATNIVAAVGPSPGK